MMQYITKGLVIREVKTGESDRILNILTPERGILSVAAKGSMRPKSKLFSASGMFCYSEWTLFEGRSSIHQVDAAAPIEVFFGLRQNLEGVSLAVYMAELLQILSPTGGEAAALLQLALNSLHVLSENILPAAQVKPMFELRSLSESGFMPDVVACEDCGRYEGTGFRFGPHHGTLLCSSCAQKKGREVNLDIAALAALRHIVLADAKKIFAFTLPQNSLALLVQAVESFMLCHLEHSPKSLSYLKTMLAATPAIS